MRMTTLFGRTLREAPADADSPAYQLLLRAGLARQLHAGSFGLLPLGMRVLRRIEAIMHAELERIEAQEFRTPVIQSTSTWEKTGRYAAYGPAMLRITDRAERALLFAPTHEEAVAELAAREISSYRQLPALVYQIHTKYRDEQRAKGGLMRMREFTMLDAYSLDASHTSLEHTYQKVGAAFERILTRCGLRYIAAHAGGGEMGGSATVEYHIQSDNGEDLLAHCCACSYAANAEIAPVVVHAHPAAYHAVPAASLIATPACSTIAAVAAFVGVPESATAKAVFFHAPERGLVFAVIRGDRQINEAKLCAAIGVATLTAATSEQISAAGAVPGYASPVGLAVQDSAGGHGICVIADHSVVHGGPLVAGANQPGYHLRNTLYGRDWRATLVADIAAVAADDACPQCGQPMQIIPAIEIGHIFQLGTRYTQALDASFLDETGKAQPIVMGSYGIGLERLLQAIIEQHHDQAGIAWPASVAPFDLHLVRLGKKPAVLEAADTLEAELRTAGYQVLYDDRDESPGVKFNDADLLGIPMRVLVSERLLAEGLVELKPRTGAAIRVARAAVLANLTGNTVTG